MPTRAGLRPPSRGGSHPALKSAAQGGPHLGREGSQDTRGRNDPRAPMPASTESRHAVRAHIRGPVTLASFGMGDVARERGPVATARSASQWLR